MRKSNHPLSSLYVAISLCLAAVATPGTSFAVECGSCVEATLTDGATTRSSFTAGLTSLQTSISAQLLALQTTISNLISAQTGAVTDQIAQSATQQSEQAQQIAQANAKNAVAQSIGGPTSLAFQCPNLVSSLTPQVGGTARAGNVVFQPTNIDERLIQANNVAGKTGNPRMPPVETQYQQSDLGAGSCSTFADANSARGMLCKAAGVPGKGLNKYLDADIMAGTLIDGPQVKGRAPVVNKSIPATGPERDAREALITNLTAASPPASPVSQAVSTPETIAYLGMKVEYDAAMSLAAYPMNDYNRATTIDPNTLDALNKIKRDSFGFYNRFFAGVDSSFYSNGVSPFTLMDLEVERRVGNIDWYTSLAGMDASDRERETLVMQAYQMRMQNLQIQATYKANMILGKLLNMQVEQTYKPKLEGAINSLNSAAVNRSIGSAGASNAQ